MARKLIISCKTAEKGTLMQIERQHSSKQQHRSI